jgi:hypothetical protein
MQKHIPPTRLPAGYHKIWQAVTEAGRRLGSRQALARRLHVSTHTLQRLLTRGDVPSFPDTKNPRVVRAWVRTITRLAVGLGHEPHEWVESVGIPWDETIARVSESASREPAQRAHKVGTAPAPPQAPGSPALHVDPMLWPSTVTTGIVDCPPYSSPLPGGSDSFLLTYARRLIGAIHPTAKLHTTLEPEGEAIMRAARTAEGDALGVGVVDTMERRAQGLRLVTIPGLRVRLSALVIRSTGRQGAPPTWRELASSGDRSDQYVLVSKGGVAMPYLLGQCAMSTERMIVRSPAPPDRLAELFLQETRGRPDAWVVLVCREETARLVANALERSEAFTENLAVSELEGAPEECPAYPLAIAAGPSMALWLDLLKAARDQALFADDCRRTARLYADLMTADVLRRARIDADAPDATCRVRRLTDFPQVTAEFRDEFCDHLMATLSTGIRARLETRGEIGDSRALHSRANGLAALYARRLIPDTWPPALEALPGQVAPETAPGVPSTRRRESTPVLRCRSCSVSLLDEDHRGVSDRYCRFCADERGHLRPRHEVQTLIARWFRYWQAGLPEDEAMRRADLYMQALPAWSDN